MSKALVDVETNIEDAFRVVNELKDNVPDSADDASKIIARQFIRNSQRVMQRNGSVVTGRGLNSFDTRSGKKGQTLVLGASYLKDLDTGTKAHWPDSDSYSFRAAARSYGIDRYVLARTIARKGTQPHPWISEATQITNKTAKDRLSIQIDKAVSESIR